MPRYKRRPLEPLLSLAVRLQEVEGKSSVFSQQKMRGHGCAECLLLMTDNGRLLLQMRFAHEELIHTAGGFAAFGDGPDHE